jgi:tetratricopeptide (TPR) repeat protein
MYTDADSLIKLGSEHIYNVEFEKASRCFNEVIKDYPGFPAGYFLDAMVEYWKITIFRDTKKYDDIFLDKIDKAIQVCNKILDTNEYDIGALFFKGGALGYRGRFYVIRESYVKAAWDGKNAYDIFMRCQELAPTNHDIMLGTGLFNYFVQAFTEKNPSLRPLLSFLPRGDKELGIMQLDAASRNARYAATEAKVVLLQVYYQFEERFQESLNVAKDLFSKYPNNAYFHRYLGRSYVATGNLELWEKTWRDVLNKYIAKKIGYDPSTAREALYYIGSALYRRGSFDMALKYFKKSDEASKVVDKKEDTGFKVKANLYIAMIYDMSGKRKEAVSYYNKILDMTNYEDSHKTAKKYLKTPYK